MNSPSLLITPMESDWAQILPDYEEVFERAIMATLNHILSESSYLERSEISLALSNDAEIKRLNHQYRQQNKATNVLSFSAYDVDQIPAEGMILWGDIIIALETAIKEATQENKTLIQHVTHLAIHGTLHLLGYDHEEEREADKMEAIECLILEKLGYPDPYALSPEQEDQNDF